MKQSNNLTMKKGQSLLEIIIATAIIVTVITAVLGLVTQSLVASSSAKLKTQASFLAQEAMEIVHNIRDTNWKKVQAWDTNFYTGTDGWYTLVTFDPPPTANPPGTGTGWKLNFASSTETSDGSNIPPLDGVTFTRYIYVTNDTNNDGTPELDKRKVSVKVTWAEKGTTSKFETSSILTNWQK